MSNKLMRPTISVVTPTLDRPEEVKALLANLAAQSYALLELVLVDGAPNRMNETQDLIAFSAGTLPFKITYIRCDGGTAIQRNIGIEAARGEFVAFIDDDMLLEPDFLERIIEAFSQDKASRVAAVAGYVTNQFFDAARSTRWRWYRKLGLFTTYEPGRFDYNTGYVINRYMQPPHNKIREIDCMGANCAVWRRQLFDTGLRFSPFFVDYGVGEDAHLALAARRDGWAIWEYGRARCLHLQSPRARINRRRVAWKTAVNYRFVFVDIVPKRSVRQELRFWRVQLVELGRELLSAFRRGRIEDWEAVLGKCEGIVAAVGVRSLNSVAEAGNQQRYLAVDLPDADRASTLRLTENATGGGATAHVR